MEYPEFQTGIFGRMESAPSIPNAEAVNQSQKISSRHANYFAALRTASKCRERQ